MAINIEITQVTSTKVWVAWSPSINGMEDVQSLVTVSSSKPNSEQQIIFHGSQGYWLFQNLTVGMDYHVTVNYFKNKKKLKNNGSAQFSTFLTPTELITLYKMALQLQNKRPDDFREIDSFYRNKTYTYYKKIEKSTTKVEQAYEKDENGDPGNPINKNINGLFFSGQLTKSGKLEANSPFGPRRLIVPASLLINSYCKLYFSDFYCNSANKQHYVTLVATIPGTAQDQFCQQHLLQLSLRQNPFLYLASDGRIYLNHSSTVRVELFYAGNVDTSLGQFKNVATFGRGHSIKSGIPKTRHCTACNIYP